MQPIDKALYPEQFKAYLEKVSTLKRDLEASDGSTELAQFANVRGKLSEYSGYAFGTEASLEMQKGYLEVVGVHV